MKRSPAVSNTKELRPGDDQAHVADDRLQYHTGNFASVHFECFCKLLNIVVAKNQRLDLATQDAIPGKPIQLTGRRNPCARYYCSVIIKGENIRLPRPAL